MIKSFERWYEDAEAYNLAWPLLEESTLWGVVGVMGEAYGQNAEAVFVARMSEQILSRLGGDRDMVAYVRDDGDEINCIEPSASTSDKRLSQIVDEIVWWMHGDSDYWKPHDISDLKKLGKAYDDYCDGYLIRLFTREEYDKWWSQKEKERLSDEAAHLAAKYQTGVNTLAFLVALHAEIAAIQDDQEDFNNAEARHERFAECMFAAGGPSSGANLFFEDSNFENGRYEGKIDRLLQVRDWIATYCPLTWLEYEESLRAGAGHDDA